MKRITLLILTNLILVGCGSNANPNTIPTLTGTFWNGMFSSTNGKNAKVSVNFYKDQSFDIAPLEKLNQNASGTYTDMTKSKSLLLDIKQSQYTLVGNSESSQDFKYEINENELILKGDAGEYLLVQRDSDKNEKTKTNRLLGDWGCSPKDGSTWGINIASTSFRGHKMQAERRTIFFEGDVLDSYTNNGSKEVMILKIMSTNDHAKLVGIKLRATYQASKKMQLSELNDKNKSISDITCRQ